MIRGIGVDVVDVSRVQSLLARQGERALVRLFTEGERRYCEGKGFPARHYAARIAAKEAAFKALSGTDDARGIGWRELEVVIDRYGRPALALHGRASLRARELGVAQVWISLSHGETVAIAQVVLESVAG